MGKLLGKELRLCMHPTVPMMLLLSAMVFIPNYPYSVIFFYVSMSLFFTCLSGRENNDIAYSMMLPVAKKDVVRARYLFAVLLQAAQLLIMIPLVLLRNKVAPGANLAGMDAGITLFAVALIDYGVFNLVFLSGYYKNVKKVGLPFLIASAAVFLFVAIEVVVTYAVPFVRDVLETPDPQNLTAKLAALAVGALVYAVLTLISLKASEKNFEKQDV